MCGRYAASARPEDLVEEFEVEASEGPGPGDAPGAAEPDFNVAPTKPALVVLQRRPRTSSVTAEDGGDGSHKPDVVRWLRLLRWGLVPSWAKDPSVGARMINARAESVLDKGSFRRAAASRRCLVPADGWYEWQVMPAPAPAASSSGRGKPKPLKRPHFITVGEPEGAGIAFAGLYEFWRDDSVADGHDPHAWLTSFTILTTAADPELAHIHDRMPLVLPRRRWDAWLDPDLTDPDAIAPLLSPLPAGSFAAYPVSTDVNSVANNGAHLLDRLPDVDPATGEILPGTDDALF